MSVATAALVTTPIPGTQVWIITPKNGIKSGTLVKVKAISVITGITYDFDVNIPSDGGTSICAKEDVFTTLHEAIVEYELRLS